MSLGLLEADRLITGAERIADGQVWKRINLWHGHIDRQAVHESLAHP
jgi:hypothetical protein